MDARLDACDRPGVACANRRGGCGVRVLLAGQQVVDASAAGQVWNHSFHRVGYDLAEEEDVVVGVVLASVLKLVPNVTVNDGFTRVSEHNDSKCARLTRRSVAQALLLGAENARCVPLPGREARGRRLRRKGLGWVTRQPKQQHMVPPKTGVTQRCPPRAVRQRHVLRRPANGFARRGAHLQVAACGPR